MPLTLHPDAPPRSWPERVLGGMGVLMFCITLLATLAGVLSRYFHLHGFEWSFEIATLSFIWVTFIGAVIAELRHENVRFQGLVRWLPARARRWFDSLANAGLLVVASWLLYSSGSFFARSAWLPTPVLRWPTGLSTLALISAAAMLAIIALVRLVRDYRGHGDQA
ncbi:TRAP transporter small permease [Pseudomonas typographi]|uniref:TRAP transporter small permease protein n=1 Tax=Pseudomonas typographi TaxID=2715964 RepID=A0ABR7Z0K3_9PSED|nr:TRAP transporter small permease subunit [Pseudomonas typographi]MBD1598851.1 TRAP transporter small permease subunit [Pseudomonas typographi]